MFQYILLHTHENGISQYRFQSELPLHALPEKDTLVKMFSLLYEPDKGDTIEVLKVNFDYVPVVTTDKHSLLQN